MTLELREFLRPGDALAGWRVLAKRAEGGMATLYRVAGADGAAGLLKLPRLAFGSAPACYAGFETEQAILGRLHGPHVPALLASGEDAAGPYLVMAEVAGTTLAEIAATAPLPPAALVRLGIALAGALHDIHRQGVVHHDLTLSHVVVGADGNAVLLDFGLACHAALPDLVAAEAERAPGTPAYIAPEQLLGVRGDPRSDIYAAGVILYALACARLPFGDATGPWGRHKRRWFDPPPPRALVPALPEWLQEVLLRCLAVRPERRYASAAQLAHDLAHPEQVAVGERGRQLRGAGLRTAWQRWRAERSPDARRRKTPAEQLARAPHVLVAVDTALADDAQYQALRLAVRRLLADEPHWRLTCVGVVEPSAAAADDGGADIERSARTQCLAALRHWAHPLALPAAQVRYAVLDGNAAAAIVDYARRHHADHIVVGARGSSGLRRFLGSVSARIVAKAPCSVTVARPPAPPRD